MQTFAFFSSFFFLIFVEQLLLCVEVPVFFHHACQCVLLSSADADTRVYDSLLPFPTAGVHEHIPSLGEGLNQP